MSRNFVQHHVEKRSIYIGTDIFGEIRSCGYLHHNSYMYIRPWLHANNDRGYGTIIMLKPNCNAYKEEVSFLLKPCSAPAKNNERTKL